MKKFFWCFFAIVASFYIGRHFLIGNALEFALHRLTGEPVAYQTRGWEKGKLVYEGFSLGEQLTVDQASFDLDVHFFPFSLTPKVHFQSPVLQLDDAESKPLNLAFLFPTKHVTVKLDMENGTLICPQEYPFDFISGPSKEDVGTFSIYQEGAPFISCGLNFLNGSLAFDFKMEEAPVENTFHLASLFTPLPSWKVLEGTARASLKGTFDESLTFLQGDVALKEVRFESDDLIFAVDGAAAQIDFQGEMETFALNSDFKGVDLFWKELEVLRGEGSVVINPKETPVFEVHAAVNIADLEGRADLVGRGFEGTLDYVTKTAMRVDFSWIDGGILQTRIHNLGPEILALFFPCHQGTVHGSLTTFFDQWKCLRMETDDLHIHQLAFDRFLIPKIDAQGAWNVQTGEIEGLTLQAQDAEGEFQGWKVSDATAAVSIIGDQLQPSSAFGKLAGIPFGAEVEGTLAAFHGTVKLAATPSEWLRLPKNNEESPITLALTIDRKLEELTIAGTLDENIHLKAQVDLLTGRWGGDFQGLGVQSSFYMPFVKIFDPSIAVQGNLALHGQFCNDSIDITTQGQDLSIILPELKISIPGQSREILYHFDLAQKQGSGRGKLSPLVITSNKIPFETFLEDGDLCFDPHEWSLQNVQGALQSQGEEIAFRLPHISRKGPRWNFDAAFSNQLSFQGQATETPLGYDVIVKEGKALGSYLKEPLSFHWSPQSKIDHLQGVVYLETGDLIEQLTLLDQFGFYEMSPKTKEILAPLQGGMTLRLMNETEYNIRGSQLHYASSVFQSVQVHILKEGPEWIVKQCSLDDIKMQARLVEQKSGWLVPSWDLEWKDLRLHASGLYENEMFDFSLDGKLLSRSFTGAGVFASSHFQNISLQFDDLASLSCEKLSPRNGKWESPAVNLTLFSKYLSTPLQTKLLLSIGPQSSTFQGAVSQGEAKVGASTLKLNQIFGLFEAPYLNLKCLATLNDEPVQLLGKFSKAGGGINIQKDQEVLKIGLSDSLNLLTAEGEFLGAACKLQREGQAFKGTVTLKDGVKFAALNEAFRDFSGLMLDGTWVQAGDDWTFKGQLDGTEARVKDYLIQELHAQAEYTPTRFRLKNLTLQDPAGSLAIKECSGFRSQSQDPWNLAIPLLKGQDIKPSALRKLGDPAKEIKPLHIRHLVMSDISGQLGDLKSFLGMGSFNFTQRVKKEPSIFDIPLSLLKDFGLDLDLFSPVIGEVSLKLKEGKLFFTGLQNAFSDGKRSEFYLAPEHPSFIDLSGGLFLNLRMQQNVVLKLAEPFMIAVRGTWEKPKYSLQ